MSRSQGDFVPPGPEAKVFVISVAAELSGLHPQTLRAYDRLGLVRPARTGGGGRRYSLRDIELLRSVARLTAEGLGLEGVKRVLELENQVLALQARVVELETELEERDSDAPRVRNLPVRFDAQPFLIRRTRR
ncbi:MerR family transcriptional regulator [Mumia sp. zg.B53]|uniref:heat shock protein transcriptional repressor HspR n=1 Tax=unclassified Mumia TaxID=2621872 RepID=UPI001C6E17E2|nr:MULTISPECIES: MerR family transcriptional regulator [unclassified Mumia]MBW9204403.1 MerR family transcriptional regulator [Mumia sp. zg.B17]MBW9209612.1 MerR family transcriptional regulator [Mumia sp. zg.B21]MBW9214216.1 MerR family transcriptional regulator [Mumia sp. zg.B53]MDD9348362.1 MerR family transcriptional regulator [Mumia sp.]